MNEAAPVAASLCEASQLPPSDIVPGIPRSGIDFDYAQREIKRLQAKLEELQPCVIRVGGLFHLYQNAQVRVQTPSAQMMWDYLEANLTRGTKVNWRVIPTQPPLNPS